MRDPKRCIVFVRLEAHDLARARRLAKYMTRGNLSALVRVALKKFLEEEENVRQL